MLASEGSSFESSIYIKGGFFATNDATSSLHLMMISSIMRRNLDIERFKWTSMRFTLHKHELA